MPRTAPDFTAGQLLALLEAAQDAHANLGNRAHQDRTAWLLTLATRLAAELHKQLEASK